jgi:hypothetical protein
MLLLLPRLWQLYLRLQQQLHWHQCCCHCLLLACLRTLCRQRRHSLLLHLRPSEADHHVLILVLPQAWLQWKLSLMER